MDGESGGRGREMYIYIHTHVSYRLLCPNILACQKVAERSVCAPLRELTISRIESRRGGGL